MTGKDQAETGVLVHMSFKLAAACPLRCAKAVLSAASDRLVLTSAAASLPDSHVNVHAWCVTRHTLRAVLQDSRVESYLQSQEEEGGGIWKHIQGWTNNASASLQRIAQQSLPGRHMQANSDESDWVSFAKLAGRHVHRPS